MLRPYAVTAVVCAGALALAVPVAAVGAAAAATGEPVTVADREAAPAVGPGLHLVELPSDGWLRVDRTQPTHTLWMGEWLTTPHENNGEYSLAVHDAERDCSWSGPDAVGEELVQVRLRTGGTVSDGCEGDTVWLRHDLISAADYAGTPATLAVWEEPPATAPEELPGPSREVAWSPLAEAEARSANLGADFAGAPVLVDGRYRVVVEPGAPALLAVDLAWGQHLQVEMSLAEGHTHESPPVRPRLINPLGMTATWATARASSSGTQPPQGSELLVAPGLAARAGVVSPTVRWRNREAPANAAAIPGRYYVTLDMEADGQHADSAGAEFEIGIKVVTDEDAASPYAEEPPPLPDPTTDLGSVESPETPPVEDAASRSAGDADEEPWPTAIGLLAGSLVLVVAGSLLLGRWRRGGVR